MSANKYKKEYCSKVIEWSKAGKNIVWMCTQLEISKKTFYVWVKQYPEFEEAHSIAMTANELFWLNLAEERGSGVGNGSDTIIRYMLSAAHGYREKTDIVQDISASVQTKTVLSWADDEQNSN